MDDSTERKSICEWGWHVSYFHVGISGACDAAPLQQNSRWCHFSCNFSQVGREQNMAPCQSRRDQIQVVQVWLFFFGGNRKQSIYLCNYFSAAKLARRGGEAARAGRKEVYVFPPFRVVFVKYKQRQVKRPRIAPAFQTTTTSLLLVSARCYFLHRKDAPSPWSEANC